MFLKFDIILNAPIAKSKKLTERGRVREKKEGERGREREEKRERRRERNILLVVISV